MNQSVPAPWSPVMSEVKETKVHTSVWGREYTFDNTVFPASVMVNGAEILNRPIVLKPKFAGKEAEFTETRYFEVERSGEKTVFLASQTAENIILNARITVEFDGFVDVAFSVIPFWSFSPDGQNVPRLNQLYLDIPVKKEYAPFFHIWPNAKSSIALASDVLNSGNIPDNGLTLPFKPYVWAGWENGGIGICSETDENLQLTDDNKAIEYLVSDQEVILRIHLLDHMPKQWQGSKDDWCDTLKPIDYRFGLQATPVKPEKEHKLADWKPYHIDFRYLNEIDDGAELKQIAKMGVNWLIFHEDWTVAQNYGMAYDKKRFQKLVDDCHRYGIKVMVYFGYEYSTMAPGWPEHAEQYLTKTPGGEYQGGWQRQPHQRAFIVCYQGGYAKEMIERVEYVMDEYGVDGIYTDGTYVPWECANGQHGCGYQDADGKRHVTYPIYAVREHVKNLYRAVHQREGVVDTHQSACCIAPTLAYCDSIYDGENIQGSFREGMDEFLTLDAFRAEYMGKNLGVTAQFISYTDGEYTIEKISGMTLLHDVHPRAKNLQDLSYTAKIWEIYSAFDTDHAQFLPYWGEEKPVWSENSKTFCSSYRKNNDYLTVVTCFDKQAQQVTLHLPEGISQIENKLTGEIMGARDTIVTISIKPYEPKILQISRM